jgi:hypothetical protein
LLLLSSLLFACACSGICLLACYFTYFLVVKGMLTIFDCSKNTDGVLMLDADPSIVCNVVRRSLAAAARVMSLPCLPCSLPRSL